MRKSLCLVLLLWLYAVEIQACPVQESVKATVIINATPDKVWDIIKDFDNMAWHPDIRSIKATNDNKKGAIRILTLKNDGTITEELKRYKADKMRYSYKITDMSTIGSIFHSGVEKPIKVIPVTDFSATISVKATAGGSVVKWKAKFYRGHPNNNPPEELNAKAAYKAVSHFLKAGLTHLLKKFNINGDESAISIDYAGILDNRYKYNDTTKVIKRWGSLLYYD
ncbi:MAG: mxaD protein [Methyloprofundus sp.]|nr:MAG: mxaD protein [Methyloprofundus sp.]